MKHFSLKVDFEEDEHLIEALKQVLESCTELEDITAASHSCPQEFSWGYVIRNEKEYMEDIRRRNRP